MIITQMIKNLKKILVKNNKKNHNINYLKKKLIMISMYKIRNKKLELSFLMSKLKMMM